MSGLVMPRNPYVKDAEGAGRFALDMMRRYRKYVAKGQYTVEEWEMTIGWLARVACHWAALAQKVDRAS